MKPHNCPRCDREVKLIPQEMMGNYEYQYYVCPSNDCGYRGFKRVNPAWHFTVERDIPIYAKTEEEAEKRFKKRYGNIPILGIIRPSASSMDKEE